MGLKIEPDFSLTIGDQDLTALVRDRLLTLSLTDHSGEAADELEIVLDDRGNTIETPRKGVSLSLALGWAGGQLQPMGSFVVDEVEPAGPPDILTIRAKAADMLESFKSAKSRAWRDTTILAIVSRIASEHGLQPAVAQALGARPIAHRDQTNESDLHFLTRLGRDHGAVASPKDGRLVFAPAASGQSASGQVLEAVALTRSDLTSWRGTSAERDAQGKVRARWRERATARTRFAEAGDGEPVKTLRHVYPTEAAAQAAAEAELAKGKRAENGIELVLPGRAELVAQTPLTITGLRSELNDRWIAETVEHQLDWGTSGFVTTVTGSRPPA